MVPIKEKLLSLYFKKLAKADQVVRLSVGYKKAQLLGLLYTYEDAQKDEAVLRFIDQVKATGKKLHILCYITTKDAVYSGSFPSFTQHDINIFGKFVNGPVADFLRTPFDYLYHVDLVSNPMLDYALAKCRAKCRVGKFDATRASLFEIMVKLESKSDSYALDGLAGKMLYYTQLLEV
ncbi:MAG: hypothetical protein AAF392_02140 [Bacteroidota bacterium]